MTATKKYPGRKWHGQAIYKIREVLSPLHKDHRGFRLIVAVPNMQGHDAFSSRPAPSFARSFLLFQSSDYNLEEMQTKLKLHIRWLLNRGYDKVEPSETYQERMLTEMAKGKPNHKERDDDNE